MLQRLRLPPASVCHPLRALAVDGTDARPPQKSGRRRPKPTGNGAAATSKGDQAIVVLVNDEPVTAYQIEQRARFLALNANISEQAKDELSAARQGREHQRASSARSRRRSFATNQGKSREQIIAIFQERQKQLA